MTKTICKKSKDDLLKVREKDAKYRCKSCGETAHKEKHLCKPKKI